MHLSFVQVTTEVKEVDTALNRPSYAALSSPSPMPTQQKSDDDVLIELRDVHKSFGSKKILRGVNIKIRRGEAVGIIGGSGTGKSTTLRLMAGLLAPDQV
jgi:ABC-type glutathione transport system ATPase component